MTGCSANQGHLFLEYQLRFQDKILEFLRTVWTTGFPGFLGTSFQLGKVLIMVDTALLHKHSNYIQDPYHWRPSIDVTNCSFTSSIP